MLLIIKYIKLPLREKLLLIETALLLITIKVMVILFPLRWYCKILGNQNEPPDIEPDLVSSHIIFTVSRAIVRSRKLIPLKNQCLTEAITAKILLKKRKLESTLYLGVCRNDKVLSAHAWLRCGDIFVTGKRGMEKFTVVSTFS